MLTSLGFTTEEGNILRGYCDASSAPSLGGLAVIYQPQDRLVGTGCFEEDHTVQIRLKGHY
ncbi:hypothetical protein WN943_010044 [Citrus x changshan-huyou]